MVSCIDSMVNLLVCMLPYLFRNGYFELVISQFISRLSEIDMFVSVGKYLSACPFMV